MTSGTDCPGAHFCIPNSSGREDIHASKLSLLSADHLEMLMLGNKLGEGIKPHSPHFWAFEQHV